MSTPSAQSSPMRSAGGCPSPEPVNLAFGTRTNLLELIALLEELLGHPLEVDHTAPRVGDVPHSQAANDRLLALFPDDRAGRAPARAGRDDRLVPGAPPETATGDDGASRCRPPRRGAGRSVG